MDETIHTQPPFSIYVTRLQLKEMPLIITISRDESILVSECFLCLNDENNPYFAKRFSFNHRRYLLYRNPRFPVGTMEKLAIHWALQKLQGVLSVNYPDWKDGSIERSIEIQEESKQILVTLWLLRVYRKQLAKIFDQTLSHELKEFIYHVQESPEIQIEDLDG